MQVRQVIISALNLLGRQDIADIIENGKTVTEEAKEMRDTLVFCFNAVEDELARKYVPLTATERLRSANGEYAYTGFAHSPVKIKRVTVDGKEVKYQLTPQYIAVDGKDITVEYEYAPKKKDLAENSDYGAELSEYLMALGIAAEYCLINGEIEAAELWEKRYRSQIDVAQGKLPLGGSIPPRRWV